MEYYSIEQIANIRHVTPQAIYKQINGKRLKKRLEGQKKRINGKLYISQDGLEMLLDTKHGNPMMLVESESLERIRDLEQQLAEAKDQLKEKEQNITKLVTSVSELITQKENSALLLESKSDELRQAQAEIQRLKSRSLWQRIRNL